MRIMSPGTWPGMKGLRTKDRSSGARRRVRWLPPTVIDRLEERVVPAFTPLASEGLVVVVVPVNEPEKNGNGFQVDDSTGQVCAKIELTAAGIARLRANALDGNPTNDAISVGISSYILTDGQSTDLRTQEFLDIDSGELSLGNPTETFCVDIDDVLCTQVDAHTGSQPLDFSQSLSQDVKDRFLQRGAIFSGGEFITAYLSQVNHHHCPDDDRGNQGLTIGYWKNHLSSWQLYTPDQTLGSIFASLSADLDPNTAGVQNPYAELADDTLEEALSYHGGPSTLDKARLLLKQSVAALLNAAHSQVHYPLTTGQIKVRVNNALESQDQSTILALQGQLDGYNNLHGVEIGGTNTNKKKK